MEKRLDRFIWKSMFLILPILFLPLFSNSVFAAHPLITDDTGTQGKGKFLLEVNNEVNYAKESEAGVKSKTTGGEVGTILSYGIIDNVDIVLGIPCQWFKVKEDGETISREKGLSDISLELKWRFYEREGWSFALKPVLPSQPVMRKRIWAQAGSPMACFSLPQKRLNL
jgi:hypothetical protein